MKKTLILLLALVICISAVFASCSSKNNTDEDETQSTESNLESGDTEIGFETDENGDTVPVVYEKDKKGNTVAIKLDKNGEKVTNKNGEPATVKTDVVLDEPSTTKKKDKDVDNTKKLTTTTTQAPTATTKKDVPITSSEKTTKFEGSETVPKTSASGKEVNFSVEDQETITSMLEVPYLYLSNYENSDGVPIDIACHTAVWMAEHEGSLITNYPSSPIVLNLFKFYGQTVVNFKTQCNEFAGNAPITYNKEKDTFTISEYTEKKQSVKITKIEDLGDNNFYKVTGKVSGCGKSKVVAVIQKNRLEPSLGFSIKALKWS